MISSLRCCVFAIFLVSTNAFAQTTATTQSTQPAGLRILLVDPSRTDTADNIAAALSALPNLAALQRVDIAKLPAAATEQWNTIVWLNPEPLLYKGPALAAWNSLLASKDTGLLILGLPHNKPGRDALMKSLESRGQPAMGIRLGKHVEGAIWIWSQLPPKDYAHVYFRKTFDLATVPPRAWIQCAVDNEAKLYVNGTSVGTATQWRKPDSFDVTTLLCPGKNTIAIDAYNDDGPGGVLFQLAGFSPTGELVLDVHSEKTWLHHDAPVGPWSAAEFDASTWTAAKELGAYGEGVWQDKLRSDYGSDEYTLSISDQPHPATAGIRGAIGRCVVLDALTVPAGATVLAQTNAIPVAVASAGAGGKLILCAADPEKTSLPGRVRPLNQSNGFSDFVAQSALWLASSNGNVTVEGWRIPETAVGGQMLSLRGSLRGKNNSAGVRFTVRDGQRLLLDEQRSVPNLGDVEFKLPLPSSWDVTGPLRTSLVVMEGTKVSTVRSGALTIIDPVPFDLVTSSRRWVFKAAEAFTIDAEIQTSEIPPLGRFEAKLVDRENKTLSILPPRSPNAGKAQWPIDTKPLRVGTYTIVARYIAEGTNELLGQQQLRFDIVEPASASADIFPVAMTFTPVPYEGVAPADTYPHSQAALRRMVDNLIDHGITMLHVPVPLPHEQAMDVLSYAQSRGMTILHYFERSAELFGRMEPPKINLYSPKYAPAVRDRLSGMLPVLDIYPRIAMTFVLQDEPFHQGMQSFGFSPEERAEFEKRFGYLHPLDAEKARLNPPMWMDILTFRADYFPVGWRQVYKIYKELNNSVPMMMNHDSHNTFGGGVGQESKVAIDDVYHWGGDWADGFSYDIYPYLMPDFRYGPNRELKLPRISQMHYSLAQMRNLTESYNRPLGFWYGTYNPEWYDLKPEMLDQYWMEREMCYTAVAAGADFLIDGIHVPIDAKHWDDMGAAMKVLHKVGPQIKASKRVKARAAMLYPRSQTLLLQEEYWNVGQSYEAFLRAFGELDVLHEEQIDKLSNYKILVLFDVKLLPASVAEKVAAFVEAGGVVIADCVPNLDEYRHRTPAMEKLFGVTNADTYRILWPSEPAKIAKKPAAATAPATAPANLSKATTLPAMPAPSASLKGNVLGVEVDIPLVSPRVATNAGAEVLLNTSTGAPGVLRRVVGKGRVYLLGFCVQDTDFETWRANNFPARAQLYALLGALTTDAAIGSHVRSSNPDIEAALRSSDKEAFLFIISHESKDPATRVQVRDLPFPITKVIDVETDKEVPFTTTAGTIELNLSAPTGATHLLHLTP